MGRNAFRVGFTGEPKAWKGALRDLSGAIVWLCPHTHDHREHGHIRHRSAIDCARAELQRRFPFSWAELSDARTAVELARQRVDRDSPGGVGEAWTTLRRARLELQIIEDDFRQRGLLAGSEQQQKQPGAQ
jgi:hypothetical protein